jgi:hypothetical protein
LKENRTALRIGIEEGGRGKVKVGEEKGEAYNRFLTILREREKAGGGVCG